MKRRHIYALWIIALAAIVVAILAELNQELTQPGSQSDASLVLYDQPRPVPSLQFQNAAGQTLTLDDFRGRALLVNIWATWCKPCREEMASLDQLQARLGDRGFQVVAISQDKAGLNVVDSFYKELGIRHLQRYIDVDAQSLDALKAPGVPFSILIGRQGQALGYAIGARQWDSDAMIDRIEGATNLRQRQAG